MSRVAVVLFNLGGPDSPAAVRPFLLNLFRDPAILTVPAPLRAPLAWLIATRRTKVAREIYGRIGGSSPILAETEKQARALQTVLGDGYRLFIAMRYWHPFSVETARAVMAWNPDRIVLLPLYPQFSTTSTGSSLTEWERAAALAGLSAPSSTVTEYPELPGMIAAQAELVGQALEQAGANARVLFSAHGLPERIVAKGDPYPGQVERTARAIVARLGRADLDFVVCYQSRVGPVAWLKPYTDKEIRRAGKEGRDLVVVPIAFVSEHSETLVELDMDYRRVAEQAGVKRYVRVPALGAHPAFIAGLAELVREVEGGRLAAMPTASSAARAVASSQSERRI